MSPRFARVSDFGQAVRAEGRAVLAAAPSGRYADAAQWARSALFVALFIGLYAVALSRPVDLWSAPLAVLIGAAVYAVIATLCHDASHGSLAKARWVNALALHGGFMLIGVSGALWGRRHVREHHMFANVEGSNIDGDGSWLVRLSPATPWRWWHLFQPVYGPLLYLLVLPHLAWWEDWEHLAKARREDPARFRRWDALGLFALTKVAGLIIGLALPAWALDLTLAQALLGYAVAAATASFFFVMINIGSHISDAASFVSPDAEGRIGHDWATHQAMTAIDWSPESRLACALTGGANAHAAHHLFPEAAHCHNAALSKVVSRQAAAHDRPHHVLGFWGMLSAHATQLWRLSRPEPPPPSA